MKNARFVFFPHKPLDKHNSQRKAPLDLVYSKIDIAFAVLHPFVCNGLQLTTAKIAVHILLHLRAANATPFCSSECAHAQFNMQARWSRLQANALRPGNHCWRVLGESKA